jgi:hypothetical protein
MPKNINVIILIQNMTKVYSLEIYYLKINKYNKQ